MRQGIFVLVIFSMVVLSCGANDSIYGDDDVSPAFVSDLRQNYQANTNNMLVEQITSTLGASYIYRAYASYFQRADVALPGVHKYFEAESRAAQVQADMLTDYINQRGGNNQFKAISLYKACRAVKDSVIDNGRFEERNLFCICDFVSSDKPGHGDDRCGQREYWKNALNAFHDALLVERYVNSKLLLMHTKAEQTQDIHLANFLEQHFLDSKVKSIHQLAQYVTRLRSFEANSYQLGEHLFDKWLN